jgi:hypothetical protein
MSAVVQWEEKKRGEVKTPNERKLEGSAVRDQRKRLCTRSVSSDVLLCLYTLLASTSEFIQFINLFSFI